MSKNDANKNDAANTPNALPVHESINVDAIRKAVIADSHPAANLFPLMSGDEFHNLLVSMRQHGFDPTKPITRAKGSKKITDGRNREVAVRVLNEEAKLWNADPANKDNPKPSVSGVYADEPTDNDAEVLQGVLAGNFTRRHLSSSQKAAVIVKAGILSGAYQKKAELGEAGKKVAGDVVELIAAQNGVNSDYIYKVKAVAKGKNGRALLEEIASGAKSVMAAYAEIKAVPDGKGKEGDSDGVGDDDAVLDGLKKPVAEEMKDYFRIREKFAAAEKLLRDARSILKDISAAQGGELLADGNNLKEATAGISATARAIKNTKPHVVCPHCSGDGKHPDDEKKVCPACAGLGYLTEPQHDSYLKNGVMEEGDDDAGETGADETAAKGEETAKPKAAKGKKKAEAAAPAADAEPAVE